MPHYVWVDCFDTLGMGRDMVIVNGTNSDSLIAFDSRTEKFTVIHVPYPLNTYTRGLDGRIDDAAPAGRTEACGSPTVSIRFCMPRSRALMQVKYNFAQIPWRTK